MYIRPLLVGFFMVSTDVVRLSMTLTMECFAISGAAVGQRSVHQNANLKRCMPKVGIAL